MRHALVSCFMTALTRLLLSGAGHFAAAQAGGVHGPAAQPGGELVQLAGGCPSCERPCDGEYCGESRRAYAEDRCGDDRGYGWRCDDDEPSTCGVLCWLERARDGYCGRGCGYYLQRHQYPPRYDDDD